ncbi:radical SAM protein [Bacteroides sp. 224]|uniref:radical SAM protein n=1 Tax=Bacteroides sp. 224 TaxID=2302936 RepID=UPI0013D7A9AD|nr:radical SAM protein [Bacteroides sp. 224]NDV65928.1 radical SAM protein [Bacteroides sp. 224]
MKRIFYFNVTYTCNSSCAFCYSHNTIHSGVVHNEIEIEQFVEYLRRHNVGKHDRVIINGGEPFLHSNIIGILKSLKKIGCETLIYTNGRRLFQYDLSFLDKHYRFVIPVHGHEKLHDSITKIKSSFAEMIKSFDYIKTLDCLIDVKVIVNNVMASNEIEVERTLLVLDQLPINHAVHITKMADTIISHKNNCPSVTHRQAARCTNTFFNFYVSKNLKIKIFDTCVKLLCLDDNILCMDCPDAQVFFKDNAHEWNFECYTPVLECRSSCEKYSFCYSAVSNYNVLEYNNGKFYKGFE